MDVHAQNPVPAACDSRALHVDTDSTAICRCITDIEAAKPGVGCIADMDASIVRRAIGIHAVPCHATGEDLDHVGGACSVKVGQ